MGIEAAGVDLMLPVMRERFGGRVVLTNSGRMSKQVQKGLGDAVVEKNDRMYFVEFKVEEYQKTANLFLETWSNRKWKTPGWMLYSHADWLWYFYLDTQNLYCVDFTSLCSWAFGCGGQDTGRIYQYPERLTRHQQLNDTWGRCVPVEVLSEFPWFKGGKIVGGQFIEHGKETEARGTG